jgi:curved DNA-binding protein CbpA
MSRDPSPADPYKVLQIDPAADDEIVQVVYRRLARKYHPDVTPGPEAATRMIEINAAMELLSDPLRRAAYDRERAIRERLGAEPGEPGRSAAGGGSASGGGAASSGSAAGGGSASGGGAASSGSAGTSAPRPDASGQPLRPQTVSRDWTSGRSSVGGGYDPSRMRTADGHGAAGPPPGNPSGTVLNFGRYSGWSLGEIARGDLEYLEWLDRMAIGRIYREELDGLLRKAGRRRSAPVDDERRGLFRRR